MIIIVCDSILSLPWWSVKRILWQLGVLQRIKARRWPALRPSTDWKLEIIEKQVTDKIGAHHEAIEDTLLRKGVSCLSKHIAKRSLSIWMPVTIRSTASRKDVSFTATMAATAICLSLPLSAQFRSGPSCAPATGTRLEGRSRLSRKSCLRSVNVAPKPRSLSGPIAAFVARRSWPGARPKNQGLLLSGAGSQQPASGIVRG
jgi:hypothetical protein